MSLVEFQKDVFPYCKGDVVKLEGDEKKRIDEIIDNRGLTNAYTSKSGGGSKPSTRAETDDKAKQ